MYHIVYQTTCLVNNKIYIGVHSTEDINDDYLGSGFHLKKAIEKYGRNKFKKDIIKIFDDPKNAYELETQIVNEDFIKSNNTYNIVLGGKGGYLGEQANQKRIISLKGSVHTEERKIKISLARKGQTSPRKGVTLSQTTKDKISETRIKNGLAFGENNPMYNKKHSNDTKNKMRKPHLSAQGKPKPKKKCPHCQRNIAVNVYNYWHGNNCKLKM